ncbi:MAG TPA: hypothetical protein VJ570_04675 [Holophagaceae bacterium]|nr:hypothetical protein [Holophagaceae bacterium]
MAIITLQLPPLTKEQKKSLGNGILYELQKAGIAPASTVVIFKPLTEDVYMDSLLVEAPAAPAPVAAPALVVTPVFEAALPPTSAAARKGARLNKADKQDLRGKLLTELRTRGSLSSFEAQEALGLKDQDGAPATLRRLFSDLEEEGIIGKTGQKRGTRYVLKGVLEAKDKTTAGVKLIKAESADDEE